MDRERIEKAKDILEEAMEKYPQNDMPYFELGNGYLILAEFEEAEKIFKKGIEMIPEKNRYKLYYALGKTHLAQGKRTSAERYYRKAQGIGSEYGRPMTRKDYQKLKEMITRNGIKLVLMQHPGQGIKPLKKTFDNTTGIIFIDNEKIFKKAIKKTRSGIYFDDSFADDGGHLTAKGNRLLAETIADVLLKKYFKK